MPKLLANVREKLLTRAGELLKCEGYGPLSIRRLAQDCGVAQGTVYNYFRDKDSLVASVLLADWQECMEVVETAAGTASGPEEVLRAIHSQLLVFAERYRALFQDESAKKTFGSGYRLYHGKLRESLTRPLERFYDGAFLPQFVAEAMLSWTMEGKSYEELAPILNQLCPSKS